MSVRASPFRGHINSNQKDFDDSAIEASDPTPLSLEKPAAASKPEPATPVQGYEFRAADPPSIAPATRTAEMPKHKQFAMAWAARQKVAAEPVFSRALALCCGFTGRPGSHSAALCLRAELCTSQRQLSALFVAISALLSLFALCTGSLHWQSFFCHSASHSAPLRQHSLHLCLHYQPISLSVVCCTTTFRALPYSHS